MKYIFFFTVFSMFLIDSKALTRKLCRYDEGTRFCFIDNFFSFTNMAISCNNASMVSRMIIMPSKRLILDFAFRFSGCNINSFHLNNFGGILIDFENTQDIHFSSISIFNSDFLFFFKGSQNEPQEQSFFNKIFVNELVFSTDVRYYLNTPKLAFKNASVSRLTFFDLSNSSIKVNYFAFKRSSENHSLNSKISGLTKMFLKELKL